MPNGEPTVNVPYGRVRRRLYGIGNSKVASQKSSAPSLENTKIIL